jgi:hypothetical protein
MRDIANEQFRSEHYVEAMDMYVQAMVGLDQGFCCTPAADPGSGDVIDADDAAVDGSIDISDGDNSRGVLYAQREFAMPILTNLAACTIETREWKRCLLFCEQALALDPCSYRALCRQGRALTELERFAEVRPYEPALERRSVALAAQSSSARGSCEMGGGGGPGETPRTMVVGAL